MYRTPNVWSGVFSKVNFLPLDIRDEEDIALVLHHADYIVQYGEDLEPKQPKDDVRVVDTCRETPVCSALHRGVCRMQATVRTESGDECWPHCTSV